VIWQEYRLGPLVSPVGIARDPGIGSRARVRHGPLNQPFPSAIQAMISVGADPTSDPPSACPLENE
jgi:hypothetical protein